MYNFTKLYEKEVLFLQKETNKKSKELLIIANTHVNNPLKRENFLGLMLYTKNPPCDLLFIKDPNNSYYLDDDLGETYQKLLKYYIEDYEVSNITFFGASMSGFAALYHGLGSISLQIIHRLILI